tara:strand:+ start:1074 stop:1493 length:420 start_codon:yes stop_codon:yes gene_type:complete
MNILFCEINEENIVLNVTVWDESILGSPPSEENGKNYLANFYKKSPDKFVQTYTDGTRKIQAGGGVTWDPTNNVFILPKPFDSWILDTNYDWQPPIAYPNTEGYTLLLWQEQFQTWDGFNTLDNLTYRWNPNTNQWDNL